MRLEKQRKAATEEIARNVKGEQRARTASFNRIWKRKDSADGYLR